ncbi:selenocysteine-specific translation elongation factor [Xenorhabdus bovienii]|uniref:selenocysteine-specific translation elongation factor n=1 Tax=Xenorhabdus bovienii TaxID=40576 RepID=UPI001EDE67BB|nr:selenocysteine-specific translation elongation factor [Xenorhabdus bovienii]MCG3464157.1 selenocysteine-specific translation elongation factor [Xenorhabdus bovienii]
MNILREMQEQARFNIREHQALPAWSDNWASALCQRLAQDQSSALKPVFNLSGTVLHTNLGRAVLAESAIEAVTQVMRSPVTLEYSLDGAGRGHRDRALADLLCSLTGAEDACIVNNNAAAVLLVLATVAQGKQVVVSRGDWLLSQKPLSATEKVLVEVETDEPLQNWQPLHIHHAASHITGRISLLTPLSETPVLAELVLDRPLWLTESDRLILRDISARRTLAGARVINLNPPRRGKRQPEFLNWLAQLAQSSSHTENLALHLPRGALSLSHFAWARQLTEKTLNRLLIDVEAIIADGMMLSQPNAMLAEQKLLQILTEYHEKHPDQLGLGKARLKRMALPALDDALVYALIHLLLERKGLKQTHGWLHLPEHGLAFTDEQASLWSTAEPYFKDEAWWVRDLAAEMGKEEETIRYLLRKAAQLGLVTAIVSDRYYHRRRIQQFADVIRKYNQDNGGITAVDFRNALGVGRKLAIQILEFFDRTGFTRRKSDWHILRDEGMF